MKRAAALQPLSHDHHAGLAFVARLRRALRTGTDLADWPDEIAAFWRDHLVPHFADEEATVLPVLEAGAPALAEQMTREHREVERIVREVEATPASLERFADALAAHIRFEERETFPAAERLADAATLAAIAHHLTGSPDA
jgi:hemerythrin-like domain-containing protein